MNSSDRLEQLKQQILDTSKQQRQLQEQREKYQEDLSEKEKELRENEKEMIQFIRSVFGQSELISAKERECLKDTLDKFNHQQMVMNEKLIVLIDMLADTTSLNELYRIKSKQLDLDYENKKEALEKQLAILTERLNVRKRDLQNLNDEISRKQIILDGITEQLTIKTKKQSNI